MLQCWGLFDVRIGRGGENCSRIVPLKKGKATARTNVHAQSLPFQAESTIDARFVVVHVCRTFVSGAQRTHSDIGSAMRPSGFPRVNRGEDGPDEKNVHNWRP